MVEPQLGNEPCQADRLGQVRVSVDQDRLKAAAAISQVRSPSASKQRHDQLDASRIGGKRDAGQLGGVTHQSGPSSFPLFAQRAYPHRQFLEQIGIRAPSCVFERGDRFAKLGRDSGRNLVLQLHRHFRGQGVRIIKASRQSAQVIPNESRRFAAPSDPTSQLARGLQKTMVQRRVDKRKATGNGFRRVDDGRRQTGDPMESRRMVWRLGSRERVQDGELHRNEKQKSMLSYDSSRRDDSGMMGPDRRQPTDVSLQRPLVSSITPGCGMLGGPSLSESPFR